MLIVFVLLFVLFLAACFIFGAPPELLRAGLYLFGGIAALNVLYVLFWVLVAAAVDDTKPLEKPSRLCVFGCRSISKWLCFWAGVRVRLTGAEKLPQQGRYVLVCNHRSMFDPLTAEVALGGRTLAFISKPSNLKIPFVGKLAYGAGFLPIDRENDRNALRTILTAADYIKRDFCSIGIYPEGTRSKTKELLPFHAGSFKIAQKAGVPLAVACTAGTQLVHRHFPFKPTDVSIDILEVLPVERVKAMKTQELAAYSRELMESALNAKGAAR